MEPSPTESPEALKVIDISVTLRKGLASWPGEDFWSFEAVHRMDKGDPCNVSRISMGLHTGTHVDAPWHFGKSDLTVDKVPLNRMVIGTRVLDLTGVKGSISRADLEGKLEGTSSVLFKTTNSGKLEALEPFDTEFVHLDESAADYLVEQGIITVGVDYLSVEGYHAKEAPVHHSLLGAGVFIIEGLDLSHVEPRDYLLIALPLKIEGADGAPARAVLIDTGSTG